MVMVFNLLPSLHGKFLSIGLQIAYLYARRNQNIATELRPTFQRYFSVQGRDCNMNTGSTLRTSLAQLLMCCVHCSIVRLLMNKGAETEAQQVLLMLFERIFMFAPAELMQEFIPQIIVR